MKEMNASNRWRRNIKTRLINYNENRSNLIWIGNKGKWKKPRNAKRKGRDANNKKNKLFKTKSKMN
jgi:hypothetical protein